MPKPEMFENVTLLSDRRNISASMFVYFVPDRSATSAKKRFSEALPVIGVTAATIAITRKISLRFMFLKIKSDCKRCMFKSLVHYIGSGIGIFYTCFDFSQRTVDFFEYLLRDFDNFG